MESEQQPAYSSPLAERLWHRHVLTAGVIPKQRSLAVTHDHWPSPGERLPLLGEIQRRWRVAAGAWLPIESLPAASVSDFPEYVPETNASLLRPFAAPLREAMRVSHAGDQTHADHPAARVEPLPRMEGAQQDPVSSPRTPASPPMVVVGVGIRQRSAVTSPGPVVQRKMAPPLVHAPRTVTAPSTTLAPEPALLSTPGPSLRVIPAMPVPVERGLRPPLMPMLPRPQDTHRENVWDRGISSVPSRTEDQVGQVEQVGHAMPRGLSRTRTTIIPQRLHVPAAVAIGLARPFRRVVRNEQTTLSPVLAQAPRTRDDAPTPRLRSPGTELPGYPQTPRWGVSISPSGAVEGSRGFQPPVRGARNDSGFHLMPLPVARTTVRHETTAAVPTPRTPAPVAARSPVEAVALPTLTASSPDPQVDVGQLAEHVYTILVQRLTREKHRRG